MNYKTLMYGFEDYKVFCTSESRLHACLYGTEYNETYIPIRSITKKVSNNILNEYNKYNKGRVKFEEPLIPDNTDILNKAQKLYVHPACKISRTLISSKYKKCLYPWAADAVVVPNKADAAFIGKMALFLNEDKKILICIIRQDPHYDEYFKELANFGSIFKEAYISECMYWSREDIENAVLISQEPVLTIDNENSHVKDILIGAIPSNKIVTEREVLQSLSDSNNQITLENMLSIKEMLKSKDKNVVGAALKSLAALNYIDYPESTKLILDSSEGNFIYNKARYSTIVKYMLNTLNFNPRRMTFLSYKNVINQKDYDLFKELLKEIHNVSEDRMYEYLSNYPFMHITSNGTILPIIVN